MPKTIDRITRLTVSQVPSLLGIVLSLTVGSSLYLVTANAIERDHNELFTSMALTAQATLNARIKTYADVLRGASSLFRASEDVSREEFHRYVSGLDMKAEFPGIETINFARHITDAERDAFEAAMRQQARNPDMSYPTFRIYPPGRRAEYTVLAYIEPIAPWADKYGMDLQSRPTVALNLAESRDTGLPSTSGTRVPLKVSSSGLGMRMPVYRPGLPLDTVAQRRAAYIGSVGIGFGVDRLMQGVLDNLPRAMHVVISGMSPDEKLGGPRGVYRRVLFFDNMPATTTDSSPRFELALPIGVSHRGWIATFGIAKSQLRNEMDIYLPWLAMLAGSVSTFLLCVLYQTLSSSRRRAVSLAKEMTHELRTSEAKLQQTNDRLRRLAAHAENIKEGERKRIAREIHDDLGQNLLALRIEADLLASRTEKTHPRLHARAIWTLTQIDTTIKSVRQIINDLRPNVLDLGLSAAVDWQIAEFRRRTGAACELVQNKDDVQVSDRCATALFRILQESLTNITRHAHASRVRVELRSRPDRITMTVADNGVGIHRSGRHKLGSFGLVGIEERVKILEGSFDISDAPDGGTIVSVSIPIDVPPASPEPSVRSTTTVDDPTSVAV
jgi:signal transduction histidine kinase